MRQCQLENLRVFGLAGKSDEDSSNIGTQFVKQFVKQVVPVAIGEYSKYIYNATLLILELGVLYATKQLHVRGWLVNAHRHCQL